MRKIVQIGVLRAEIKSRSAVAIWPIGSFTPDTSSKWLESTIVNTEFEAFGKSLWMNHPNLKAASEELAAYITPWWPAADGEKLLDKTIRYTMQKVSHAIDRGETFEGRLIGLYLYGLASCIRDVARVGVYGYDKDGNIHHWKYFSEPLKGWAKKHNLLELEAHLVENEPTDEQLLGLRMHLVARITSNPDDAGRLEMHAFRG